MIGKGRAISHTRASMAYGLKESKRAEIIHRQHVTGDTPGEISREFRTFQELNDRCRRNTLGFVLSPTIGDGRSMDNAKLREAVERFLREMKLREHQGVAFVHRDREHVHLHIYVNRIDFNGRAHSDHFIGKRASHAAGTVAREMGLTTAREVREQRLEAAKEPRMEIRGIHEKVIERERPRDFEGYIRAMEKQQVKVLPHINKQNELQGFRFFFKGHSLKGSEVHPSLSMGNIAAKLEFGRENMLKMAKGGTMGFMGATLKVPKRLVQAMARRLGRNKEMEI